MSAIFFGGVPGRILAAWSDGRFDMLASVDILTEYRRVVARLEGRFPKVAAQPLLDLMWLVKVLPTLSLSPPVG